MSVALRPVVVGAGWSGLACAIELVRLGHRPIVLDAAPHAGGRGRSFDHVLGGAKLRLDNGQHLLLGAYGDTLDLMRAVGVAPAAALLRRPFALVYPDGWRLAAAPLPAPWHLAAGLLMAHGLTPAERWSMVAWSRRQARQGWHAPADANAASLLAGEPAGLVRRLWRPLCLAALNVELAQASAQVFLNVLRDSLGGGARQSHLLLPRCDLSAAFPDPAVDWLRAHGADVQMNCLAQSLGIGIGASGGPHAIHCRDAAFTTDRLVLALPADRAAALLQGAAAALAPAAAQLARLRFAPIATTYLRYAADTRLARPVLTLLDDPLQDEHGQWVFDRGATDPAMAGILSVVISGEGPYRALDRAALGDSVARQLRRVLGLPAPLAHYSVIEKHATLVPAPGLVRPPARLPVSGVYLAGDAADSPYPSTLEGSVRAGLAAARAAA
jgi:squalene-associated FAD-dependent desaturase